jgi:hypothetical protein
MSLALPVRFLVIVDGVVADEEVVGVDPAGPDEALWDWLGHLAERHAEIALKAEARGSRYLIEVEWWDGELTRWGTDVDGMVVPLEVGLHELADAINRRWR